MFTKVKKFFFIIITVTLISVGLVYSALWFSVAQKVKMIAVKYLSVDDSYGWKSNFIFTNYEIANFPFDIKITFIKPEIQIEFANELKTVVNLRSDNLTVRYPLFSEDLLFHIKDLRIITPDVESYIENIKSPIEVKSSSISNTHKKHTFKYNDEGLSFIQYKNADAKLIDSVFYLEMQKINSAKLLDWNFKLSDAKSKSVFLEYDMSYDADFNRQIFAIFDLRKIFIQLEDCCNFSIDGKFSLENDEIGSINYDGSVNAHIKNYRNIFSKLPIFGSDKKNEKQYLDAMNLISKISPASVLSEDLTFTVAKREEKIHFGEATLDDIAQYYANHFLQEKIN